MAQNDSQRTRESAENYTMETGEQDGTGNVEQHYTSNPLRAGRENIDNRRYEQERLYNADADEYNNARDRGDSNHRNRRDADERSAPGDRYHEQQYEEPSGSSSVRRHDVGFDIQTQQDAPPRFGSNGGGASDRRATHNAADASMPYTDFRQRQPPIMRPRPARVAPKKRAVVIDRPESSEQSQLI